ncbi:MAG: hypothetical protein WC867_00635 [Candidatus Pacearchaeota archaeon]|jgi:hypothetical protein
MVNINLKIDNRLLYLISFLFIIILITGFTYAYNSNPAVPSNFGHSMDEIEGLGSLTSNVEFVRNSYTTLHNTGDIWTSCARKVNDNLPAGYSFCLIESVEFDGTNCLCSRVCMK